MSNNAGPSLAELLYEQSSAMQHYQAAVARRMGLGLSDLLALEHLSAGELTPKLLGERLVMSPGAVTALLDRLERSGHLERVPHPADRRSVLLRRTPRGVEEVIGQILPLVAEIDGLSADLSDQERAAVAQFMQKVTAAMTRHARGEGPNRRAGGDEPR